LNYANFPVAWLEITINP